MSCIHLLSDEVASQVAAGEVVERPASVVKELVENAIDAEARHIEVMVRRGGISLIRVVDDGVGMDRDDALLCIERHATSKIRTGEDLASIETLGFRGEALPSIASVSRFRMNTRQRDAEAGTEVMITGGKLDFVREGGEAPGTQIEVRSLFFNLPARRKFLRTENTEMSHVEQQVHLQAIGHPEIGFVLKTDDRLVFQLPPAKSLRERIRDLSGPILADELLEIPAIPFEGVRISGFIGRPSVSRSTRAQQLSFVNGRAVENSTISHGLREGYHTALMKGQFPVTFLFIDVDPWAVDVNVHPSKREIRFRQPSVIREAVVEAVRRTLESDRAAWSSRFAAPSAALAAPGTKPDETTEPSGEASNVKLPGGRVAPDLSALHGGAQPLPSLADAPSPAAASEGLKIIQSEPAVPAAYIPQPPAQELLPALRHVDPVAAGAGPGFAIPGEGEQAFRVLGVLGNLYILMENASGMVLVDQHAAHERILFEQLQHRLEEAGVPSQRLLMPVTLELTPRDHDWVRQNVSTLQKMGIGMEEFGAGTWKLDALPQFVRSEEPLQLMRQLIDELRSVSSQTSSLRLGEEVIAKTVCRAAVKANDVLRGPELVRLIQDLMACDLPYCCPHGRPTMIQISYSELEKKFGRKV